MHPLVCPDESIFIYNPPQWSLFNAPASLLLATLKPAAPAWRELFICRRRSMAHIARRGCNYTEIKNGSTWKQISWSISHTVASQCEPHVHILWSFSTPFVQLILWEQTAGIDCWGDNWDIQLSLKSIYEFVFVRAIAHISQVVYSRGQLFRDGAWLC